MAAVLWTEDMDERLKDFRERNIAWPTVASALKVSVARCKTRFAKLNAGVARVATNAAPKTEVREDGLVWVIQKKKIKPHHIVQARLYRSLHRMADLSGGVLKSCLDVGVGGGSNGAMMITEAFLQQAEITAATRRLFVIRMIVLAGQPELLTAMDGICGVGHTPMALAGGNGHRAKELETLLRVGLDLMHAAAIRPAQMPS